MSKRKRDKQPNQPDYRPHNTGRVLPPPPPGFDPGAHIHRTMTDLYNQGVLRYGSPDKILITTQMESQEACLRNLEGSVVHTVIPLTEITRAEPDYCQRIGLETSPGHGYTRAVTYDMTRQEWPYMAQWFNPLLGPRGQWVIGTEPQAQWGVAAVSSRCKAVDYSRNLADQMGAVLEQADEATLSKLDAVVRTFKIDEAKNDLCLTKTTITLPDGKSLTGVVCTQENFDRAIDLLVGVVSVTPDGVAHRATAEDLRPIRDAQHLPYVVRGVQTEPLFKMFGVQGDRMGLSVQGLAGRMGF